MYQGGGGGGGLHSRVAGLNAMLDSHCAELIPGVAITATAVAAKATAATAARRRTNHSMVGLPLGPS
ncbi:hypothetical protein A5677_01610 [Mycobacterium malmoense]|uniref:Uncharacterized protein n=1 Tax=Mycobacterium malmoense TaxID=1780 RepID=A0A1B9DAI3_MYCMA|nr:hypothetical protein A5677_01610 [Mycobacterium malmoense]